MREKIDIGPYNRGELCPYCNSKTKLISGDEIFPVGSGFGHLMLFKCSRGCDAYCGSRVYQGVRQSAGSIANKYLRELRKECHRLFDTKWKSKPNEKLARRQAYVWLQNFMNLPDELAHIGMFEEEQCQMLIVELRGNNNSET